MAEGNQNGRKPNDYKQQKTYNSPAAGYNVPGKGVGMDQSGLKGFPNGLQGDRKLTGLPDSLPDESLGSVQSQAEKNYDKIK